MNRLLFFFLVDVAGGVSGYMHALRTVSPLERFFVVFVFWGCC